MNLLSQCQLIWGNFKNDQYLHSVNCFVNVVEETGVLINELFKPISKLFTKSYNYVQVL